MTDTLAHAGSGIVATGVKRTFGDVEAVRGIDVTAAPGEVTALVGPNGAGKTTLLLVLATLLVPDAGHVRVAGYDPVTEPDAVRARMGWSPDVFGLYDNLTGSEYLTFVGEAYRLGRKRARERAAELLTQIRLPEYADRPVHTMSRGQKQRLGMARALVHDPEVLLLDEPASGLDPRSRVELRELLRDLARSGTAVVVSSHLLGDLEELADRVVFVDHGATVGEHRLDQLPAATAVRPWRLRALDMDALVAALARNGYDADPPTPAGVDVRLSSDEAAAELIAGLVRDGVAVVACQPLGGQLEAAYLELTT
ncbi:MAG: ABC transporter ATP-binding protein [Actinobacteria bacterium]|nr:ABC transporter ATP-binding protein [Actinomycetota bacterium]MCA1720880.1 ABC transporter ATP-binding protein [Actinomycetota bacterium]